ILKRVFLTRSCHSTSEQVFCVMSSARAGISPLIPRVTADAPPEPATRNIAWLPLMTDSVTVVWRSQDIPSSKAATNSWRYWVCGADSASLASPLVEMPSVQVDPFRYRIGLALAGAVPRNQERFTNGG